MTGILINIILFPFALIAAGVTVALAIGIIKGIRKILKESK